MLDLSSNTSDLSILLETAAFAAHKHRHQSRKNAQKTPYINHPIDVARRIASPGSSLYPNVPVEILQAALLHDTIEDTETSASELRRAFGERVARIVEECTDDKALLKNERKRMQVAKAASKSDEAKHVKLADKLSNLTSLASKEGVPAGWSVSRIQEYFVWAKQVTDRKRATFSHSTPSPKCELSLKPMP